jgi:hypothetical protein
MFNFSILHTSARPDKWREIYDEWLNKADHPDLVQYILVGDTRWGFDKYNPGLALRDQDTYLLLDPNRKCYVEGVNLAARYARGRTFVVNADDQHPCEHWDTELLKAITALGEGEANVAPGTFEYVLRVPTGTPDELHRNITVMPVISKTRYLRLGYIFYPGYESMYADNDLTEHAQLDGVFHEVNSPVFHHAHPFWTDAKMDDQYAQQNRKEAYTVGSALLHLRRATGFGTGITPQATTPAPAPPQRKTIAVCLPGESFSSMWVSCWTELFVNLFSRFNVLPIFAFSSNVHITRAVIAKQVTEQLGGVIPDYTLWIDDDNPVLWRHVEMLLQDLDALPDADGITGWCWIHDQANSRYVASCGMLDTEKWTCTNFTQEVFDMLDPYDCVQIQFTGFPLFLMRGIGPLLSTGPLPFAPILAPAHPFGAMSEDTAFCRRAMEAGLKFYVDRRVKVDHLKLGPLGPVVLTAPLPTPKSQDQISPAAETLTR